MRVAYKFHISSASPRDPLLFIGLYISLCLLPLSPTHCIQKETKTHTHTYIEISITYTHSVVPAFRAQKVVRSDWSSIVLWGKTAILMCGLSGQPMRFVFHWRNLVSLVWFSFCFPLALLSQTSLSLPTLR